MSKRILVVEDGVVVGIMIMPIQCSICTGG